VKSHLVDSLNRPGGHLTGITFFTLELGPKRLGLLRELVPSAHAVALLVDAKNAGGGDGQEEIENAARTGGPKLQVLKASNAQEIDQAFSAMVQMRPDALLIVSSPLFTNSRHQIVTLANHHRIPAIYPLREYVLAGGLLSYGASIVDAYRQSGVIRAAFFKVPRRVIFLFNSQLSLSCLSISRRRKHLPSKSRLRYLAALMR
jgi:putative ABC transport system substrate-binding protein